MVQQIGLAGRLDLTSFNANVQSFMQSINDMNKEVAKVATESTAGAKQAADATGTLGVNWQRVKDIVTGIVIIDVFRQISRGLKSIARDAFDATAVFQQLMIMLEAILARDFAKKWGVPVSQALTQIKDDAQELLGWVRKVAVTTPFSVESIATALAYGQAFGFNVAQSKRLTLATGDFVAGMGLTDEHMRRIIYNFGQMLASGRVLGRELRDLANNFVPIRDITQKLADEAGIPFEEMKKAMSDANVSAEQFIGAFVELAEEDFAGAMERMSRTIRGVQQNISDFVRTLFGLELLGPVMERIAGIAADALDAAFSPETIRSFTILGETLLDTFNRIHANIAIYLVPAIKNFFRAIGLGSPTVMDLASTIIFLSEIVVGVIRVFSKIIRKVTDFATSLRDRFGTVFEDIAKNAAGWGAGIVQSLAEGMAQAIIYLVQVLQAIARIFTFWLGTHSAPRLLPELTAWGKEAMESWLKGWTSADFGLFDDIASVVTSFFRSIAHKLPEAGLIPRIIGARGAIQRAVQEMRKFGQVTTGTINSIVKAVKGATGPLKNFIKETFEFAKISTLVEAVKKALAFDIKLNVPTKILGQTVASLEDLVKLASKFKGKIGDALRGYVKALEDVRVANIRVELAQDSLNAVTEVYEKQLNRLRILQDKLREKQDFSGRLKDIEAAVATGLLTDEEARRLEMEKEEIILTHKIAQLENERDVAEDSAKARLNAERAIADEAETRLEHQRKLAKLLADEQLAAAKERLDVAKALVQMQIDQNNLIQEQVNLLEAIAKRAAGEGEELDIPGLDFAGFDEALEDSLLASKEAIALAINDLRADIRERVKGFIEDIIAPFEGVRERFTELLGGIGEAFEAAKDSSAIQAFIASIIYFKDRMMEALENIRIFWEENGPGITEIIRNFFSELGKVISPEATGLIMAIAGAITNFGDTVVLASEKLIENGPQIQESIQGWVDWVFDTGIPKLQDFAKTFKEDIIPAIKDFAGIIKENAPTIIAILGALGTAFLALRPAITVLSILSKIGLALIPLQLLFMGLTNTVGTMATAFGGLQGLLAFIVAKLTVFVGFITPLLGPVALILLALGSIVLVVAENFDKFKKLAVSTFKAIKKAIAPALKPLQKAFKELLPQLIKLKKALAPVAKFLLGVFKVIGYVLLGILIPALLVVISVITGIVRAVVQGFTGFLEGLELIIRGVTHIVQGFINFLTGIFNIIKGIFTLDAELIMQGFEQATKGLIEYFIGIFAVIVGVIEAFVKSALGFIGGFVGGIIDFFTGLYHDLIGGSIIPDMLADILSAFTSFFTEALASFGAWVAGIPAVIAEKYDDIVTAGSEIIANLMEGVREKVEGAAGFLAKVREHIVAGIEAIGEKFVDFLATGKEIVDNIIAGLKERFEGALGLYERLKTFVLTSIENLVELKDDFIQAGIDIVVGMIEGLLQKATDLYATVARIIKRALGIAEEESESSSESKRMKRLGEDWMTGLQAGIMSEAQATKTMMEKLFSGLMDIPSEMAPAFAEATSGLGSLGDLGGLDVRHLMEPTSGASRSLTQPSPTNMTVQNLNVEVNATYRDVQSEASVYYDVRAALAHIAR